MEDLDQFSNKLPHKIQQNSNVIQAEVVHFVTFRFRCVAVESIVLKIFASNQSFRMS